MFKPKFRYTHKTVNFLTRISTARELILNSPLIPKYEATIREEAVIHSVHSSTGIEDNRLSLEQISELVRGRDMMASQKDKQEVMNYLEVLENLEKLTGGREITEQNILNIHKMLTKDTLENPADCGVYRNRHIVVTNRFTGEVIFRPASKDVPELMKNLAGWLNSPEARELDTVIEAGITHYEFVRIHPFADGNGKTVHILISLILFLREFDIKRFFCLDDYYDSDMQAYYKALQSVDQKTLDLTKWLEYFVEGVNVSISAVKERVMELNSERLRKAKTLTERQMQIVEFINQNGKITNRDVRKIFKLSDEGALKEIKKLIKLGVIKSQGKGRSLHYILQ